VAKDAAVQQRRFYRKAPRDRINDLVSVDGRPEGLRYREPWYVLFRVFALSWQKDAAVQQQRGYKKAPTMNMSHAPDQHLLDALLDSWDRNNTIMLNLLRALPETGLEVRATESSPSVAQQFMHINHERLVSVFEEAHEFARDVPAEEWMVESDRARIAQMLNDSAKAVRDAVRGRVLAGRNMDLNYDHPILMLQLLLWHEGYHHGQIKLALKLAGHPISNDEAGPLTWDVWRGKINQRQA
jgi:uncharacterized damage-inducible protein DinB